MQYLSNGKKDKISFSGFFAVLILSMILWLIPQASFAQDIKKPDEEKLKAILADFEKYAEKGMHDWGTPGMAIAIVQDDKVIFARGFGVRKLGGNDPVTKDTIFQIGSTSKAFTTALVAMIEDEGKIKWDDRVVSHLPDFMMFDPWVTREFTIMDLMSQHSGLAPYAGDFQAILGFDRDHIMHSLRFIEPVSSFRLKFAYQNGMFLVASELVEKYTGKSWEENIAERIFKPLGMSSSSTDLKSFQEEKNVAYLHKKTNGKITALPMDWLGLSWVYTYGPAGGINSNIIDMAKWLRLQINNGSFEGRQLISENNVKFLHSPRTIAAPISTNPNQYYCEGWIYREYYPYPIIWHNGGTSGHKTMIAIVPQAKIGIVVLSNYIDSELPESLAYYFFDKYFGNPAHDWSAEMLKAHQKSGSEAKAGAPKPPAKPVPAMPLNAYTGEYSNDIYGKIKVEDKNGNLIIIIGPKQVKMYLKHWDRDTFAASMPDLSDDMEFAKFNTNIEGKAASLTIAGPDGNIIGVFQRVEENPAGQNK
ncbi:MAG: serine hydrolase [Firmicutes bacterium]|nr:serine hydrolase [Bacillota bacterium]